MALIGTRLFGLSDAPIAIARNTAISGPQVGAATLTFKAPSDLVTANDLVTVLEFFKGPKFGQRRS